MKFSLHDFKRVRRFDDAVAAMHCAPGDGLPNAAGDVVGDFSYRAIYSSRQGCWVLGQYKDGHFIGYLEKENA